MATAITSFIAQPTSFSRSGESLVLMVRETPLSEIHLENMLKLSRISRMGVVIAPPVPAF
jgi:4-hydroxy-3-polyprenylbenzoate decarboxylase